jgi:peptidyl-prolyl cis-trans isomerase A (cyclophilin A)
MANRHAIIETNLGTIKAELFEDKTPITAGNFIKLAQNGYYNGVIFHRVIDGFMIQGGDPTGTGRGGPGYNIKDEFVPGLSNVRGVFSMANTGRPNTGGSQFFITVVDCSRSLDNKHTVFGKVVEGMEIVDAISKVRTDDDDRPVQEVVMNSVTIV